ncbi:hypothetical protein V6B14_22405 (plasmid) [Sporosarcina psychrophila]|uniref:ParM/StbA family protein n=1 Tax=Sporosarcina psychrophila TaxID=1476 RepID=UPI0030D3AE22
MGRLVLGVDAGNFMGKVAGPYGVDSYRTAICDWFARDIKETFAADDMEFEFEDRKGYSGTIAAYEDVIGGGAMYGSSKAHEDGKVRVLLGLYRYINRYCPGTQQVSIVTGQPVSSHKEDEKQKIVSMLQGSHEFTVNGARQRIDIMNVAIAAEGSGAFWSNSSMGKFRIIDCGSGTINCVTIIDKRHIINASASFNFGTETTGKKDDLQSFARDIIRATTTLMWDPNDTVLICGGIAHGILKYIASHYVNASTMTPKLLQIDGSVMGFEPVFANAVGFYEMARLTYR